jgi:hypothetical protein
MRILLNTRSGVTAGALALVVLIFGTPVSASSWNGIEPFKSRRADVIKILGEPLGESPDGVMRFAVMGGSVQVSFVSERFVAAKKLRTDLAGTVLEIVLQHEHSSDTPESLKLVQNRSFTRDETQTSIVFRNLKEGLLYTFMQGNLRTTRYTFGDEHLGRARRY